MKRFTLALAALCCVSLAAPAQEGHGRHTPAQDKESAKDATRDAGADASGRIRRGQPIGDSRRVAFADALKEPKKFAGKPVVIEGSVERVCQAEGCWMQIVPDGAAGAAVVRVTFDHKFAVPKDSAKMKFRAEGTFSVKTLSRETVEHLVKEDGAKIKTNPDGTADEVSFLSTGVELWK